MRSDQQSADMGSARPRTEFPGKRRVSQKPIAPLMTPRLWMMREMLKPAG
jgi:hypothetical protein